jgi:hypothetical protein
MAKPKEATFPMLVYMMLMLSQVVESQAAKVEKPQSRSTPKASASHAGIPLSSPKASALRQLFALPFLGRPLRGQNNGHGYKQKII